MKNCFPHLVTAVALILLFQTSPFAAEDHNSSRSNNTSTVSKDEDCDGKKADAPCDMSITEAPDSGSVTTPRDAASGLPTGKRQHKPLVITKELDKSSPLLMEAMVESTSASSEGCCPPEPATTDAPPTKVNDNQGEGTIRNDDLK